MNVATTGGLRPVWRASAAAGTYTTIDATICTLTRIPNCGAVTPMTRVAYSTTNTSTSDSHVRTSTSDTNRRRSGAGMRDQTSRIDVAPESRLAAIRCDVGCRPIAPATMNAIAAPAMATPSPARTPSRTPNRAISAPPNAGAMAIGIRRVMDCTVKPMVRWADGSASPMIANTVGLAALAQHITNGNAANVSAQFGDHR